MHKLIKELVKQIIFHLHLVNESFNTCVFHNVRALGPQTISSSTVLRPRISLKYARSLIFEHVQPQAVFLLQ